MAFDAQSSSQWQAVNVCDQALISASECVAGSPDVHVNPLRKVSRSATVPKSRKVSQVSRFFYPVQYVGDGEVLVMCAYEGASRSGVDFHSDRRGELVVFSELCGAEAYCRYLNERQASFPARLPTDAVRFFQQSISRMRTLQKDGRHYVVALLESA